MKRIYIFGLGKGKNITIEYLRTENVEILGYLDNNAINYKNGVDGKKVFLPEKITEGFDYIIVTLMRYKMVNEQLLSLGVKINQIINFFSYEDTKVEAYWEVFQKIGWRMEVLSYQFEKKIQPYCQNLIYEISDKRTLGNIVYPKVMPSEDAVELILREHKSLVRFGDGEFEMMNMRQRAKFQKVSEELADRLRSIIRSDAENILVAISDTYGSLERYTKVAQEDIRGYLTPQIRYEHMECLDLQKTYYDSFLSRPYILYKDKGNAATRFERLKEIWRDKKVLIVEGHQTRMGVGNDLLSGAKSVRRILAPSENAFAKYNDILAETKALAEEELILIALGATATVLAYDLAMNGFWAMDIGHLDIEYEWYLLNAMETCCIPYKYVNEVGGGNIVSELPEHLKEKYQSEIICDLSRVDT